MKRKDKMKQRAVRGRAALLKKAQPERRDVGLVSVYNPLNGDILVAVRRGLYGASNDITYRIPSETIAGVCDVGEDGRKELAVLVNNLGLLTLAQLSRFNLAESLDQLPKAVAEWGHLDIAALRKEMEADGLSVDEAMRMVHGQHGRPDPDDPGAPLEGDCECRGTTAQMVCAKYGCGFCSAAEGDNAILGVQRGSEEVGRLPEGGHGPGEAAGLPDAGGTGGAGGSGGEGQEGVA